MQKFKNYQIYFITNGNKQNRRTILGRNKDEAIENLKMHLNYNKINDYIITKVVKA